MGDSHPLQRDLFVADNALTEVLLDDIIVGLANVLLCQCCAGLGHSVDITLEFGKHRLTVEGALVGLHQLVEDRQLLFTAG